MLTLESDPGDAMSHPMRLSLEEFHALVTAWRAKARDGDVTTCLIADALDSVLRRRLIEARDRLRAKEAQPTVQTWWKLF